MSSSGVMRRVRKESRRPRQHKRGPALTSGPSAARILASSVRKPYWAVRIGWRHADSADGSVAQIQGPKEKAPPVAGPSLSVTSRRPSLTSAGHINGRWP